MSNAEIEVDDPADSFEYDEHGCLVQLTPEAFDYFMMAMASPARVGEVVRRLHGHWVSLGASSEDPYVEEQRGAIRQLLVNSEDRLRSPITQLALMRLSRKCEAAVLRFKYERMLELRVTAWLEF